MGQLWVTSKRFPAPHGFTVRAGGVSEGPYASLNLGSGVGDAPERVAANVDRVKAAAGMVKLYTVSQVHGDGVVEGRAEAVEADAVWTAEEGAAVGVKTADCVPILIADAAGRRVMAVHSGWRGTEKRIAARAVEALAVDPKRLVAAIGPCIQVCCYEVSEDVAGRFQPEVVSRAKPKPHLDLSLAVKRTLMNAGMDESAIDVLADCTHCDPGRFFSHRRDQGRTGRHLSFAVCRF